MYGFACDLNVYSGQMAIPLCELTHSSTYRHTHTHTSECLYIFCTICYCYLTNKTGLNTAICTAFCTRQFFVPFVCAQSRPLLCRSRARVFVCVVCVSVYVLNVLFIPFYATIFTVSMVIEWIIYVLMWLNWHDFFAEFHSDDLWKLWACGIHRPHILLSLRLPLAFARAKRIFLLT